MGLSNSRGSTVTRWPSQPTMITLFAWYVVTAREPPTSLIHAENPSVAVHSMISPGDVASGSDRLIADGVPDVIAYRSLAGPGLQAIRALVFHLLATESRLIQN